MKAALPFLFFCIPILGLIACKQNGSDVAGTYWCTDTLYERRIVGYDSALSQYTFSVTQHNSTYAIDVWGSEDGDVKRVKFLDHDYPLNDEFTFTQNEHHNGGHEELFLQLRNNHLSFTEDYYSMMNEVTRFRVINGKKN